MGKFSFEAVIFDLDGVITQTAIVHFKAWKEMFDAYLKSRAERYGEEFKEFTHEGDYLPFVDGKPRYDGVKSFLKSRGIEIPFGDPSDPPDKETVCGLGNRKNEKFLEIIKRDGVDIYPSTIELIKNLIAAGIKVGVASSSKSCQYILQVCGIEDLFQTRVDGVVSAQLRLKGKPEPDIFITAVNNLKAKVSKSIVVEDAISGVSAGRNGGFGLVLGVARKNNEDDLLENGADIVVTDLSQIDLDDIERWFNRRPFLLFDFWDTGVKDNDEKVDIIGEGRINSCYFLAGKTVFSPNRKLAFFLDYDGTLTPIVERPELAVISEDMKDLLQALSRKYPVAVVSGRVREDVSNLVGLKDIVYAGSHGFDISIKGETFIMPEAEKFIPIMEEISTYFKQKLSDIQGVIIEDKKFSVAVHYRLVADSSFPRIEEVVNNILSKKDDLRCIHGKKVFEIIPAINWDKGKAVRWIMQALKLTWNDNTIVYIGDDTTDEDAFRVIGARGVSILVCKEERVSSAIFRIESVEDVKKIFCRVLSI